METLILNADKIVQKINRIAHQIIEDHYDQPKIYIAGISGTGYKVAGLLFEKLKSISQMELLLLEVIVDKKNPITVPVEIKGEFKHFKNGSLILVDDVLNSGKTLLYALKPFMEIEFERISTAVLVDRSHKQFPIHVDYVGMQLATTLAERIEVREIKGELSAYLF